MGDEIDWLRIMPDAWRVFFRFRTPRPVQASAMPHILRGASTLISSPTASGKTEAVFAPLYQRHVSFRRTKLSVIYIAPTKALVNDMYSRLAEYFSGASSDIIQRYTGDHHDFSSPDGKFALLCTPEALDSLQLLKRESLSSVRAVVCDELHLLHGTSRGQQLRSVLARVRHAIHQPIDQRDNFQVVAMTATMQDRSDVAELWLGPQAEIIDAGEPRPIQMETICSEPAGIGHTFATRLNASPQDKVLLFANTRNQAHELAAYLHQSLEGWPVYLHVGILARSERERIEYAMKHERRGVCVATSTLEVGIDIGDVDVVALCQPPKSVSSFLQRIGRGNRRSGNCVVWALATKDSDQNIYGALIRCGQNGILDDVHEYHRYSVDLQQLLSLAWVGVKRHDELTLSNYQERSGFSVSDDSLSDMLSTGMLKEIRGALVPNDMWMDFADDRKIHSVIVGARGIPVVDAHSGETIATADQGVAKGLIFAGTRMRAASAQDDAGVYVENPARFGVGHKLAKLPTSYGGRRGHSRQLAWALAEGDGTDPRQWQTDGSALLTHAGEDYNLLLATILRHHGITRGLEHDSISVSGVPVGANVTPSAVLDWAKDLFGSGRIASDIAVKFREANAFTKHLSKELQRKEAYAAVPVNGFERWLTECTSV
jgi:ATP-dependent Lhr-like helicase